MSDQSDPHLPEDDLLVNLKSHQWDEGDRAIVLRYECATIDRRGGVVVDVGQPAVPCRWTIIEQEVTRVRDGYLRWHDKRVLHYGYGGSHRPVGNASAKNVLTYTEACFEALRFAKDTGTKIPIYYSDKPTIETDPLNNKIISQSFANSPGLKAMLVAQWKHGEFVNNEKNHILRTMKEDI